MKTFFAIALTCVSFLSFAQKESIYIYAMQVGPFIKRDTLRGTKADSAIAAAEKRKKDPTLKSQAHSASYSSMVVPIFKEAKDAARYQSLMQQLNNSELNIRKRDSIFLEAQMLVQKKAAGSETKYMSDREFKSLNNLPNEALATTKNISIQNIQKKLPEKLIQCLSLEKLELLNCSFKKLPRKLTRIRTLRSINIINNQINKHLRFSRNSNLTKIVVRGKTASAPVKFKKLKNLNSLDLSGMQLSSFPFGALQNKKLKQLTLNGNEITLERDLLVSNSTLEALDLAANRITEVPKGVSLFSNLKRLNLAGNQIEKVDPAIGDLTNLQSISFYNNSLKEIPDAIYKLKNLIDLDLYYNKISKVDHRIANWEKLEILYLSNNQIFSLPENINTLSNLKALYLHNNRLSDLPSSLSELKNLKVLRVNNNYFSALPSAICQLASLENLDLSSNQIRMLPEAFWTLGSLKILTLAANPWEDETHKSIVNKANELRTKNVIVHLNTLTDIIEDQ